MTGQALLGDGFRLRVRKPEYLGFVAATSHVVRTRTMAALATLLRGTARFIQRRLPVRRFLPGVVDFLVTSFAGLRSHVLGSIGGRPIDHRSACGLSGLIAPLLAGLGGRKSGSGKDNYHAEQMNSRGLGICWHVHWHVPSLRAIFPK